MTKPLFFNRIERAKRGLLSQREASEFLGISPQKLTRHPDVYPKPVMVSDDGKRKLWARKDLETYLTENLSKQRAEALMFKGKDFGSSNYPHSGIDPFLARKFLAMPLVRGE